MPQILYIHPTNDAFAELYRNSADVYNSTNISDRNSGFDLFCDASAAEPLGDHATLVSQGCRAVAIDAETGDARAFWLAPRSSISRTPWRLTNSMGLIDSTYRGVIKAAFSHVTHLERPVFHTTFHQNRLCQLAAANLRPWQMVQVVAELPGSETTRGERGFGSTGR